MANSTDSPLKSDALLEQLKQYLTTDAGKQVVKNIGHVYQINISPKVIFLSLLWFSNFSPEYWSSWIWIELLAENWNWWGCLYHWSQERGGYQRLGLLLSSIRCLFWFDTMEWCLNPCTLSPFNFVFEQSKDEWSLKSTSTGFRLWWKVDLYPKLNALCSNWYLTMNINVTTRHQKILRSTFSHHNHRLSNAFFIFLVPNGYLALRVYMLRLENWEKNYDCFELRSIRRRKAWRHPILQGWRFH